MSNEFLNDGLETDKEIRKDTGAQAVKVGRPKGAAKSPDMRRNKTLQVRVTVEEEKLISAAANRTGCGGNSHFIRKAIFDELDRLGMF